MEDAHRELQASGLLIHRFSEDTGAGQVPAPVVFLWGGSARALEAEAAQRAFHVWHALADSVEVLTRE